MSVRVGIDIGGTFTDVVVSDGSSITVHKVSSTPSDPSVAFANGLSRVDGEVGDVRHGTTVATNAVLTRTGARLAFVTTHGFRHVLQLARQNRPSLYDLRARRPAPVVDASRCVGVVERLAPDGSVLVELDEDSVRDALSSLPDVDGVAVCLLHSYANDVHERRVGEIAREVLGDDVPVALSCDVLPEFREYERASTTALDAYVRPVVASYLSRVESATDARVGVMWSGGGVRGIAQTIDEPINTMFSGPAAGVLGAIWAAEDCGLSDLVTLDMGGTSADVALVEDGRAQIAESSEIDGLPFKTPCLDVISVGAGGGSIAWVDEGSALRVGPASAGASPGPACYGRGGTDATVTDAQCVLGMLGGSALAGGELTLDVEAARAALTRLGDAAGLSMEDAAHGVLRVVRATMARAVRQVSVERGRDVRNYALVAFGGAGPLHACALADELGVSTVLIPPASGALAALGLLVASRRADVSVSRPMSAIAESDDEMGSILADLVRRVDGDLRAEGVTDVTVEFAVDMRYDGQSHELRIETTSSPSFEVLVDEFHRAHRARYGFDRPDVAVEAVTFRATALGPQGTVTNEGRGSYPVGAALDGPQLITETDSTTLIEDGWRATVQPNGSLLMEWSS